MPNNQHIIEEQIQRLKEAANVTTDTSLSNLLGITQGGFSGAKRRGKVPYKWFVAVSTQYGASLEWLITGKEEHTPLQSQHGSCSQCSEVQRQLAITHERLYQSNEEVKSLLREAARIKDKNILLEKEIILANELIDSLNKELELLKNQQQAS